MSKPILWIVIPCYNEEQVLPITAPMFLQKIHDLTAAGLVSDQSRVLFVNDGSRDKTWELITGFAKEDEHFIGISQSRNRGHQNAVLAGLMEALHSGSCDASQGGRTAVGAAPDLGDLPRHRKASRQGRGLYRRKDPARVDRMVLQRNAPQDPVASRLRDLLEDGARSHP